MPESTLTVRQEVQSLRWIWRRVLRLSPAGQKWLLSRLTEHLHGATMDAETLARLEEMLADDHHVIQFANKGWMIAHPLVERLDGSLFDCNVFWDGDDPGLRGRFNLEYDEDGVLVLGARIDGGGQ